MTSPRPRRGRISSQENLSTGEYILAVAGVLGGFFDEIKDVTKIARLGKKKDALKILDELQELTEAQRKAARRYIKRGSSKEEVVILRLDDGSVIIRRCRPGRDGHQCMDRKIRPDGTAEPVVQRCYDKSGKLVHCEVKECPKGSSAGGGNDTGNGDNP